MVPSSPGLRMWLPCPMCGMLSMGTSPLSILIMLNSLGNLISTERCFGDGMSFRRFQASYLTSPNSSITNGTDPDNREHVKSYTKHDRETFFARLQLYRRWLLSSIFAATDSDHHPIHSGNLVIYPVDTCGPVYRDNLSGDKVMCHGIDAMNISPITGGAEVSVVVGDTPYESRVSGNEERMPFAVSVIGQPGEFHPTSIHSPIHPHDVARRGCTLQH